MSFSGIFYLWVSSSETQWNPVKNCQQGEVWKLSVWREVFVYFSPLTFLTNRSCFDGIVKSKDDKVISECSVFSEGIRKRR